MSSATNVNVPEQVVQPTSNRVQIKLKVKPAPKVILKFTPKKHTIPKWGVMFTKSGWVPSGVKLQTGTLNGHLGKDDCRGPAPAGVTGENWYKKFRSVEDGLKKKLDVLYSKEPEMAKIVLDRMRDAGWVRDKAADDLEDKEKIKPFVEENLSQWENMEEDEDEDEEGDEE